MFPPFALLFLLQATDKSIASDTNQVCNEYILYQYELPQEEGLALNPVFKATLTSDCVIKGQLEIIRQTFDGFHGKLFKVGYLKVSKSFCFNPGGQLCPQPTRMCKYESDGHGSVLGSK